jgi:glycosyltransferase involved in cell wall biosynthesis
MSRPLRVAWLAPYPVTLLTPTLRLARTAAGLHPCSWIVNLANALAARDDVELHLVTETCLVTSEQTVSQRGIKFHVLPAGVPFLHRGFPHWFPLDAMTGFRARRRRMVQTIQRLDPDLVHAHGTEAAYGLAAVDSQRPCLVSVQGVISELARTNSSLFFRLQRRHEAKVARQAAYFSCRTQFDSGFIKSQNSLATIFMTHEAMSKVFFQYNWQPSDQDSLLFVGALTPWKGLDLLLQAMRLVLTRKPRAILRVIGGTPGQMNAYREKARALEISTRVEFLGFLPADEIARWHRESQVFVLPSQNENSPNTLAEAMVSGMPVIATNVGGIPSMVEDGKTGLLVPWNQPDILAGKIVWLLQHPEECARLGANARQIARERHDPARVAEQTLAAYRQILQDYPAASN